MLVLLIALLFVLLFAHALRSHVRGHDPLAGEVSILFGALTGIFVLVLGKLVFGDDPPRVLATASAVLILLLPWLTLRLVSRFHRLPAWLLPVAALLFLACATPLVLVEPPWPWPVVAFAVIVFVLTEVVAALFFGAEAQRRRGSARLRLYVAAAATGLFAAAVLATQWPEGSSPQVLALLSSLGYFAAFMPPRRLRSMSAMAAAHLYSRALLAGQAQPTPEEVWRRFAASVHELTETDAVVVLARTSEGETTIVAAEGIDPGPDPIKERLEFDRVNRFTHQRKVNATCPVESWLAESVGAHFATLVPLTPPYAGDSEHVAMLLSGRRSLFSTDDLEVISDLGAQAIVLAGRAEADDAQRRLATELGETVDALHVASKAKSDLLARVSHEFRTPLTAIIGYSALLRRSVEGGDPMLSRTGPDRIHSAGLHLLALVEEVLDLAQMDAGHFDLEMREVDVAALIDKTMSELRPLANRKRLSLHSEVSHLVLEVDPNRIRQVLYNLLSNAIKFTPAGGTVTVLADDDESEARIHVVDDGIGIPLDDQPRIFDEFTQVAEHGPHEGTGLGLAIVRRLVAAHGGRTGLTSAPGEGSRFTVTLPRSVPVVTETLPSAAEPGSGVDGEDAGRDGVGVTGGQHQRAVD